MQGGFRRAGGAENGLEVGLILDKLFRKAELHTEIDGLAGQPL